MKERLKKARKKLGLTQEKFGKEINLSRSNICNLEGGTIQLTDRNIKEICAVYNINENWLRNGEGETFVELSEDDEFNILVGKLIAEEDTFKKKVIKEMLKLEDEDWVFMEKFINKFKG